MERKRGGARFRCSLSVFKWDCVANLLLSLKPAPRRRHVEITVKEEIKGEKKSAHCSLIRGDVKLEWFRNCAENSYKNACHAQLVMVLVDMK